MKTISNFRDFYYKSKDRASNKNEGRTACNEWLSFFTSNNFPSWLSTMTVATIPNTLSRY